MKKDVGVMERGGGKMKLAVISRGISERLFALKIYFYSRQWKEKRACLLSRFSILQGAQLNPVYTYSLLPHYAAACTLLETFVRLS